ncbi:YfhO family protein [Dyadobacter fanqingshengii]|uniref:YfhO family protein n=1 Tax=Dyadobacter fanqingshengii TaxID=2906443 RepID=A0A9X1TAV9_9BACT|nr:YfhO family protein [Dyadobacter fanqingshengii]MCF0042995.1 YfhO family protein [Dyadobacter fanqingshengii]MCF2506946.1 YfhO family protein [Dyadobacter fanqingshengii]USJ35549.1 YfhO family protein [Dyadobacter fanqingshengii]
MKNLISWQRSWPHLVAVIGFMILSIAYVSPVLQGKKLTAQDDVQAKGAAREVLDYNKQTGIWSAWTNGMFSGMPAYLVAADYPTSVSTKLGQAINRILPAPANYFLIGMVSAYILFLVLGAGSWLAAIGGVAFAFSAFNVINLEAGHVSQVIAIMYAPGVLAGVILAFRKNWLAGAALTGLFLSLELYANHVQITYYLGIGIIILVIIESVSYIKKGLIKDLTLVLAGLAFAAVVAVGTHTTRLWNAFDYTKETIRGKSELTPRPTAPGAAAAEAKGTGLDKEYAFTYSYGFGELLTLVIPNAYGGTSYGPLTNTSETYKTLIGRGVDPASASNVIQQQPLYWGDQPIMGGPNYVGIIVFFLFVLGLFIVKNPIKYWAGGVILLYIIWALGKSFAGINYLFFDYFPMFNKFRAMTMVVSLAQLLMVLVAVLALAEIAQKRVEWKEFQKSFLITLGITGGVTLILALMPGVFFNFQAAGDPQYVEQYLMPSTQDKAFAQQIMNSIVQDRASLMKSDAIRSLIFLLLAAGLVWFAMKDKVKPVLFYGTLLILVIFDLFGIDKRYLNNEDFLSSYAAQGVTTPSPADEQILRDTDPNYRVYDLSSRQGPFNSADASYFHKSLGGYHGAKLRRYQELFERQIATQKPNANIINMLNTKYILIPDQQGNKVAQTNPEALGNAWFVKSYKVVPNADAEMAALDSLKTKDEAVLDQKFASKLTGLTLQPDSTDKISLTSYKPNELIYESNSKGEGLAVFSEIYYNVRDEWKVTIDDKPADMLRANYILRALRIPAGKHMIKFSFEPVSVAIGSKIDLVSSLLLVGLIAGAIFVEVKKKKNTV